MYELHKIEQRRVVSTDIPGPESLALQRRRGQMVSAGAGTLVPVYIDRDFGAILVDVDGNQFVDLGCGIGVTTIGHAHPAVAEAVSRQVSQLTHTLFTVTPYASYVRLCERLAAIVPGDFEKKSILVNPGAEAVENAVKIARKATGRRIILALNHAFHGRTNLTMTMTYRPWPERAGMGPSTPDVLSVPSRYPFRDRLDGPTAADRTIDYIRTHVGVEDVAALFVEPIQGDGGAVVPAPGYLAALREFCTETGILLVADEIQVGMGRTGTWCSIEHEDVVPDMVTLAKGLAGGLPLASVTGRADIMDAVQPGGIGGTFGGNPSSVAAAHAVLDTIEQDGLFDRARQVEGVLTTRLEQWGRQVHLRGSRAWSRCDVRGRGRAPGNRPALGRRLNQLIMTAASNGVIVLDGGSWDSVLRIVPSITIDLDLLEDALDVVESAIGALVYEEAWA